MEPSSVCEDSIFSKDDRVAWIEALILATGVYSLRSLGGRITSVQSVFSVSIARLRNQMHQEGLNSSRVQDRTDYAFRAFKLPEVT